MLTVDPPDHTRLRNLVSKAFTPRMIEQLRPRIQEMTDELLDAVQDQGRMELINDFAYPLPMNVISEMLGIPVPARPQFREWARTLMNAATDPRETMNPASAAMQEAFINYIQSFIHYIQTLVAEKRSHPGLDLVSSLVQVQEEGDTLSENELISTIWLLIAAGHETTVNLIGNSMLTLLQHPDQMQQLRSNPSLLPSAIEELLRYAGPVMIGDRWASEDVPLHGEIICKGDMVLFSLIGANLDPQQFPDPADLNIARQVNKHVAFGKGIHVCLGAPLARLEGQIAIGTLLRRMPHLRLLIEPEQLVWAPIKFRSLISLPVVF
jgi:cytochrome P450 PksS